ncbi:A disintegrin and metalloproteinase with thrombospondin motifs 17-like [Babylonia areolata]|uniref:A disintegrin and metalloproteinase with thrombospondin motifs 17-like n=1 Tax=Babylonia areolata TaxID=304850 RepID=UPI003FCF231F
MCQMSQGSHSYVCRHLYNRPASRSICQVLWCLVNATYCTGVAPVDGLPCGAGRRCLAGECRPFDDVPEDVTDTCYTGDKPGLAWRDQTCSEVVGSFTHLCKDRWYQDFCCQTCQGYYTGNASCPYGNAHGRCAPFYCNTRWEDECCEICP